MAVGDGKSVVGYKASSSAPNGAIIIQPGEDGYSDGYNVIQGVRAFDPSLGSFTTPDAYAGDISDPMSRKPFVWDRNNPVEYSDPSGYCAGPLFFLLPECIEVGGALLESLAGSFGGTLGASGGLGVGLGTTITARAAQMAANSAAGKAGEAATAQGLVAGGATLTNQITVKDSLTGVTARFDHFAEGGSGAKGLIETKTGKALLSKAQEIVRRALQNGTAYAVGKKALEANLRIGPDNPLPAQGLTIIRH